MDLTRNKIFPAFQFYIIGAHDKSPALCATFTEPCTRYQELPLDENNCLKSPAPLPALSLLFACEGLRGQHTNFRREGRRARKMRFY